MYKLIWNRVDILRVLLLVRKMFSIAVRDEWHVLQMSWHELNKNY